VLAWQSCATVDAGTGDRDAARLAAERFGLEDRDVEAALGELMRGRQAADAAAENRNTRRDVR
jgi:hypothetical protein